MSLSRQSRVITALAAFISMLFMQLAVAAYACPSPMMGLKAKVGVAPALVVNADMPGCTGMDMVQPSLCHAYDHGQKQALDKPDFPQVLPFTAAAMMIMVDRPLAPSLHMAGRHLNDGLLSHATAPPLSIRNCCFRI